MIGAVVEVDKLLGVVLYALLATLGITTLFSLAILGLSRASERRANGTNLIGYGAVAVMCLLCCLAAVAYGVAILAGS